MNRIPTLEAVIQSKWLAFVQHLNREIETELISDSEGVTPDLYECNWKQKEIHCLLCQTHRIFQTTGHWYQAKCACMFCILLTELLYLEHSITLNAKLIYHEGSLIYPQKILSGKTLYHSHTKIFPDIEVSNS